MGCINCNTPECDCPVRIGTDCSTYNQDENLDQFSSPKGTVLSVVLQNINTAFKDLIDSLASYFQLSNIGSGAEIYEGINSLGVRQLRSISNGDNTTVVENAVDITINVPEATETVKGVSEIATQTETDAGTDATKIITPATLKNYAVTNTLDTYLATAKVTNVVTLSAAEYAAIITKDANTMYVLI